MVQTNKRLDKENVVITQSTTISCDKQLMQVDVIYNFLKDCYWAKGIPKNLVVQSIDNSLCFGAFIDDKQVAFARVITDKMSFAYLADVFVLESYRGNGISKKLMTYLMAHNDLQCIRRFMLCTADAHGLYQQFGFSEAKSPEMLMARHQPKLYLELG
jgi:N-acetylglutamate synthase-like GNAT family acetyltransferase